MLKKLWWFCFLAAAVLLVVSFVSCQTERAARMTAHAAPPKPRPASQKEPVRSSPSYTYIGEAAPAPETVNPAKTPPEKAKRPAVEPPRKSAREKRGRIPDLIIELGGISIESVIERLGYLPAVMTRNRLLGKISGQAFQPVSPAELTRYAARGRSGANYPQAEQWLRRVADELQLSPDELQIVLLVPKEVEARFIAAQQAALNRHNRNGAEIALMRARYDPNLALIVDALVDTNGVKISVRRP